MLSELYKTWRITWRISYRMIRWRNGRHFMTVASILEEKVLDLLSDLETSIC